jgi:hypothetical protein
MPVLLLRCSLSWSDRAPEAGFANTIGTAGGTIQAGEVQQSELNGKVVQYKSIAPTRS